MIAMHPAASPFAPTCHHCCPAAAGKRATGDLYAIKVMRKVDLIRKNMVQSVKNERNILAMANNPFVVRGADRARRAGRLGCMHCGSGRSATLYQAVAHAAAGCDQSAPPSCT